MNLQGPDAKPSTKKADLNESVDQVTNIFDLLDIEPDTEHTMTEATPSATKARNISQNVVFEEEHSSEETYWLSRYPGCFNTPSSYARLNGGYCRV